MLWRATSVATMSQWPSRFQSTTLSAESIRLMPVSATACRSLSFAGERLKCRPTASVMS